MMEVLNKINELKKKINAVILAHNYQTREVQDIADFTGDSLELSRKAADTEAEVIIFCGVDFMAETAKVLSPDKKVILPVRDATCPMANMVAAEKLRELKKKHPGVPVVAYVNTTAEVKAESDVCCTSSNAVKVVESLDDDKIIFVPDQNLGHYVSTKVDKDIILWPGYCFVHNSITEDDVKKSKEKNPDALFMAHPECRPEVLRQADFVTSTGQMFGVVEKNPNRTFIVGTEEGMFYPLKKRVPSVKLVPVTNHLICRNMKKITVDDVISSMESLSPEIEVSGNIIKKAYIALERMLEII